MSIPVLVVAYKRPDHFKTTITALLKQHEHIEHLYVALDAPASQDETDACQAVKTQVHRAMLTCKEYSIPTTLLASSVHLGCRERMVSALDMVLHRHDRSAILEEDCEPAPDWLKWCITQLVQHEQNDTVMHINGTNPNPWRPPPMYNVDPHVWPWGWATWARAWQHWHTPDWDSYEQRKNAALSLADPHEQRLWRVRFEEAYRADVDVWSWRWRFAMWNRGGLAVTPHANLISNTGFGPDARMTTDANSPFARLVLGVLGDT